MFVIVLESAAVIALGLGLVAFSAWAIRNPDPWWDFLERNSFPKAGMNFNVYWWPKMLLAAGVLCVVLAVSWLVR